MNYYTEIEPFSKKNDVLSKLKKFNPEIREYYNRLIGRGKKPQVALNNVKNKLIRIIVALVRKKVYYDPKTYMFYNAKFTDVKKMLNS